MRQQSLARAARDRLRRLWRFVDPARPQGSWALVAARAAAVMTVAQAEAARGADAYVAAALAAQGAMPDPAGATVARAFAGAAADGRDLAGLLGYPAFEVSAFVDRGMDRTMALAIGGRHLDRIAVTEVVDAARVATGVAMVADRTAVTWVRYLTLPSCPRCVVLAGSTYRTRGGASFLRHPGCDCVAIPASEVVEPQSPRAVFDAMSDEQLREAGWSQADIRAIRDGADVGRVVNAHRGLYVAGGRKLTREATTRRGTGRRVRLVPEQIYREAAGDRDEAIRLLKRFGYVF